VYPVALDKLRYFANTGYIPHAGQHAIHTTPARFKVLRCGRRWGKTVAGSKEAEIRAWVQSPLTGEAQMGWIVGPNYTDAEKEFAMAYNSLRSLGVDKDSVKFVNNKDSGSLHIKTNWGFQLVGKSAAHPETLVGEGLDFVLMVEAGRHKRRTWGEYIRPALSDKRGSALFSGVPEGTSPNSLLYALYERGQSTRFPQWRSWKRPSWTNDIIFPGGREDPEILEAESDLTEDEFARQYGAEFRDKVGVVMKEYDDDIHLGDFRYVSSWETYMAIDYGFTNPFVVLFIQVGPSGQIRIIREVRYTQVDTPEVCDDLLANHGPLVRAARMMYPDPAEPDRTRTMMSRLRIPAASNTGGDLSTRISLIRRGLKVRDIDPVTMRPLGMPDIMIDRNQCKELAWEMREGYRWPEHRSETRNPGENPLDKDNHGVEALGRFMRGRYVPEGTRAETTLATARMG
jgi:hypothetical protein